MLGLGFLCVPRGGLVRAPGAFNQMWTLINVELSTVYTFKKVTLESTGTNAVITAIAGTTYSKNGGAYTAAAGVISDEDTLTVRIESSAEYETEVSGGVIIGGVTCAASATTEAEVIDTSQPPGTPLLFIPFDTTDSIGLSVEDYVALPTTWQAVFFTDADTPILHTGSEWMTILLADASINDNIVLAVENAGALVYPEGTEQSVLDAGLAYLQGLVPVSAGYPYTFDFNLEAAL